jgi:N-acetylneuraminic acid mutarotase
MVTRSWRIGWGFCRPAAVTLVLCVCVLALSIAGCADGPTAVTVETATDAGAPSATTPVTPAVTSVPLGAGAWTDLAPSGDRPAPRDSHALVYDSSTARMILFGGWGGDITYFSDTWAYDPAVNVWTELDPAGAVPAARAFHQMVSDSNTGRVILFGGARGDEDVLADTWTYDPVADVWTELTPVGAAPPARMDHALVYDAAHGRVILFGGWNGAKAFADTWAYDPASNTWTDLHPAGDAPSARDSHALVYDPDTALIYLFGGFTEQVVGDMWAYDPAANTWTELRPAGEMPAARDRHRMVYDPVRRQVLLFGGWLDDYCVDDTWAYDPAANAWVELDPNGDRPSRRDSQAMAYDPGTGKVILFGGVEPEAWTRFEDTWSYGD